MLSLNKVTRVVSIYVAPRVSVEYMYRVAGRDGGATTDTEHNMNTAVPATIRRAHFPSQGYAIGDVQSFGRHGGAYSARYRLVRIESQDRETTRTEVVSDATSPKGYRLEKITESYTITEQVWEQVTA